MNDKSEWIIDYLKRSKEPVDVLNADFVDAYIEKFNAKYKLQMYGAHKCPELGKLLSDMHNKQLLIRSVIGLSGLPTGFPKWVYTYELNQY